MKIITKKGGKYIFSTYIDNDNIIITFNNRWTYKKHRFDKKTNRLHICTTESRFTFAFSGIITDCTLLYQEKDQLIFKINSQ